MDGDGTSPTISGKAKPLGSLSAWRPVSPFQLDGRRTSLCWKIVGGDTSWNDLIHGFDSQRNTELGHFRYFSHFSQDLSHCGCHPDLSKAGVPVAFPVAQQLYLEKRRRSATMIANISRCWDFFHRQQQNWSCTPMKSQPCTCSGKWSPQSSSAYTSNT